MRIIMLDLDTLRPDHMGCYGYERNTTPNLDTIAAEGLRFNNYYCTDAPCLPSRAALITGKFGIHNGVVGHGGTAADLHFYGRDRYFRNQELEDGFFNIFRKAGFRTASVNSFAERHSAFWFYDGMNEMFNCGGNGEESSEMDMPFVMDWLDRNADQDNWFLHINLWDAHTPYRAPAEFGNPFENDPIPAWLTEEVFEQHKKHIGPHSIREINMFDGDQRPDFPRQPGSIGEYKDLRREIDGYDCGIRYMDGQIGRILQLLKDRGVYEDTAFIVTADHGEDMGELGIYSEHGVADDPVTRVPMILKFPGMRKGTDDGLHYQIDILPTMAEYFGTPKGKGWDGESYLDSAKQETEHSGRPYLVVSQCAHVCQRAVRFEHYIYIRTVHGGLHILPKEMLFDLENDPHEQYNLADSRPDLVGRACRMLEDWHDEMMKSADSAVDPLWTVYREGGPLHARGEKERYLKQLRATGREEAAKLVEEEYKDFD